MIDALILGPNVGDAYSGDCVVVAERWFTTLWRSNSSFPRWQHPLKQETPRAPKRMLQQSANGSRATEAATIGTRGSTPGQCGKIEICGAGLEQTR